MIRVHAQIKSRSGSNRTVFCPEHPSWDEDYIWKNKFQMSFVENNFLTSAKNRSFDSKSSLSFSFQKHF